MYEKACRMLAKELEKAYPPDKKDTVLIVGLGNWNVTADAFGDRK